jgi:hypothetical protein
MSMSKRRLKSEITRLKIALASCGPVIAAAEELRDACAWQQRASCEAEDDQACAAIDAAIDAICAAVDARQGGAAPAQEAAGDHLLAGFVPDAPAQEAGDVAAFLASEWPGEGEAG